MSGLSIVILTRNEEKHIASCIASAKMISDDIIIVDSGSKDNTLIIAKALGAHCFALDWQGYGFARNFGAEKAKYNWIMALDADERIGKELALAIGHINLSQVHCIYKFKRENYLGSKKIRFGALGSDTVKRIYNRNHAQWNLATVHEKLVCAQFIQYKSLTGCILHFGFKDFEEYKLKAAIYARLSAQKYFLEGRRSIFLKKIFSPLFNSCKSYFFQLGFLDGRKGFMVAKMIAYYSRLKYSYLQQMIRELKYEQPGKTKIKVASKQSFS